MKTKTAQQSSPTTLTTGCIVDNRVCEEGELDAAEPLKLLRAERDRRLLETDWWALSDVTLTQARRDYRQALRDITNTYQSLDTVVWPEKPE